MSFLALVTREFGARSQLPADEIPASRMFEIPGIAHHDLLIILKTDMQIFFLSNAKAISVSPSVCQWERERTLCTNVGLMG